MLSWKERIGNEVEVIITSDNFKNSNIKEVVGTVVGTIYEGYRYRDGMVSVHGNDGNDYCAGIDSWTIQKTESTLPDLLNNYDYIMKMNKEELAEWLTKITDDAQSNSDTKCDYQWKEWLDEEYK